MEQDAIRDHVLSATPETLEWDCFTFGVIQKEHYFTFYSNIDHLHTDGTSSLVIYGDINRDYQALALGSGEADTEPAAYRDFTEHQHDAVETLTRDSRAGQGLGRLRPRHRRRMAEFPARTGHHRGRTGQAFTAELLNAAQTEAFDTACRRAGARFSGGVLACAALADHDFTNADIVHIFSPLDTRTRDQATSVGWYASLFPISVDVAVGDFGEMARSAQKSFDANKHLSAVPFDRIRDLVDPEELGATRFRPADDGVALRLPETGPAVSDNLGMFIDDLNHGAINIWVTRNRDATTVTVSFPDTFDSRRSIHNYIAALRDAFISVAGG